MKGISNHSSVLAKVSCMKNKRQFHGIDSMFENSLKKNKNVSYGMKKRKKDEIDKGLSSSSSSSSSSSVEYGKDNNNVVCDCNKLLRDRQVFRNFRSACEHYGFSGSHQVGSYGPKGKGIIRSYSNSTPHKDKVLGIDGSTVLYRLKPNNESLRRQFLINQREGSKIRVFRKVDHGVMDLGLFLVDAIVPAGKNDHVDEFGNEFVCFVKELS